MLSARKNVLSVLITVVVSTDRIPVYVILATTQKDERIHLSTPSHISQQRSAYSAKKVTTVLETKHSQMLTIPKRLFAQRVITALLVRLTLLSAPRDPTALKKVRSQYFVMRELIPARAGLHVRSALRGRSVHNPLRPRRTATLVTTAQMGRGRLHAKAENTAVPVEFSLLIVVEAYNQTQVFSVILHSTRKKVVGVKMLSLENTVR
jgi:hypothetical protein